MTRIVAITVALCLLAAVSTSCMPAGLGRKEVQAALEDAGTNWVELAGAIFDLNPLSRATLADAVWLIVNAPHLDRLELNEPLINDALSNYSWWTFSTFEGDPSRSISAQPIEQSSPLYRRYLLNYRLDDEPVTAWKLELRMYLNTSEGCILSTGMEDGMRFAIREGGRTIGAGLVTKIIK